MCSEPYKHFSLQNKRVTNSGLLNKMYKWSDVSSRE